MHLHSISIHIYLKMAFKSILVFEHSVQGLSTGFDILWRPRRPSENDFQVIMKISVCFWGLGIWVSSTNFQKNNKGWPQQPPTGYQTSVENWIFEDPIHKQGFELVILVARMIKQSGSRSFLRKKDCRGQQGCRGHWGQWGCRGF